MLFRSILRPEQPEIVRQPRPAEPRPMAKRGIVQPYSADSDNDGPGEFPMNDNSSDQNEKSEDEDQDQDQVIEKVNLPDAGLVYVTRAKKTKPKEEEKKKVTKMPPEPFNPTFKDFEETGLLEELKDEVVGTIKWGLRNDEQTDRKSVV